MESQPQNPELRNNPKKTLPYMFTIFVCCIFRNLSGNLSMKIAMRHAHV